MVCCGLYGSQLEGSFALEYRKDWQFNAYKYMLKFYFIVSAYINLIFHCMLISIFGNDPISMCFTY